MCHYLVNQGFPVTGLVETDPSRFSLLQKVCGWPFLRQRVNPDDMRMAHLILLTVPDDRIAGLAEMLSRLPLDWGNKIGVHTSGVLPSRVLEPLRRKGAAVASLHPLISFADDPRQNPELPRCWFNLEGDEPAIEQLEAVLQSIGNPAFRISPDQKQALHLTGVFTANFYVALASAVRELSDGLLPPDGNIFSVLRPLLLSSLDQLERVGVKDALTGPVKRGDAATVRAHLEFLRNNHPELAEIYRVLSFRLIALCDLSEEKRRLLLEMLGDFR